MAALFEIKGEVHYEVVRLISEGGMGRVYEAAQVGPFGFRKRVAIKIIREELARHACFVERFVGEAKLVADLIHTNIVQTYHLGQYESTYYITMEFINGVDLSLLMAQLQRKRRNLPVELAVFIASRVARGLAYAHSKCDLYGNPLGLVHHDVHPRNIMVAFEGDVKITDFGIAKAKGFLERRPGDALMGNPDFMSPEQLMDQPTDRRSDLFSLGVVLAYLLLGYNPFSGPTMRQTFELITRGQVPNFCALDKRISPQLNAILTRLLQKDPAKRFQTADEVRDALEFYLYHKGLGPTNETLGEYVRELFGQIPPERIRQDKGATQVIIPNLERPPQ